MDLKQTTTIDVFYENWKQYQELLKTAIAPLTTDQLRLCPSSNHRPLWSNIAHIVAARSYWFCTILGEGDETLRVMRTWDDDSAPERSAAELVAALDATWALMTDCFARWTPDDLVETFPRKLWNGQMSEPSRNWVIWHVLEHDLHHGGEVSLLLGINGLAAPDL
jgi:uncharacterized damage-inducible protein DinB